MFWDAAGRGRREEGGGGEDASFYSGEETVLGQMEAWEGEAKTKRQGVDRVLLGE